MTINPIHAVEASQTSVCQGIMEIFSLIILSSLNYWVTTYSSVDQPPHGHHHSYSHAAKVAFFIFSSPLSFQAIYTQFNVLSKLLACWQHCWPKQRPSWDRDVCLATPCGCRESNYVQLCTCKTLQDISPPVTLLCFLGFHLFLEKKKTQMAHWNWCFRDQMGHEQFGLTSFKSGHPLKRKMHVPRVPLSVAETLCKEKI